MAQAANKHIIVVGAGPGGLTSAMILAHRGFKVSVFEAKDVPGGRNAAIQLGDFKFDTGPTFLMMRDILDEVIHEGGADSDDLLDFRKLEPMYRLQFDDRRVEPTSDRAAMRAQIEEVFPGKGEALDRFFHREHERFRRLFPCLQIPYHKLSTLMRPTLLKAFPHLALGKSVYDVMYSYFGDEKLALTFTFQAKYLGMSPWDCPGLFAILPYIEYHFGIYHTQGGAVRNFGGHGAGCARQWCGDSP